MSSRSVSPSPSTSPGFGTPVSIHVSNWRRGRESPSAKSLRRRVGGATTLFHDVVNCISCCVVELGKKRFVPHTISSYKPIVPLVTPDCTLRPTVANCVNDQLRPVMPSRIKSK